MRNSRLFSIPGLISFVLFGLLVMGCDGAEKGRGIPAFHATDVSGADYGRGFHLTDHTGAARSLSDWQGKVVLVFFGYTQCPDVCPTALLRAKDMMALLGDDAAKVQVVFITLDPERDSTLLLSQYVPAFDPRFVGLTGSPAQITEVAKDFKVIYRKVPGKQPETYTLDHSALTYAFDPTGHLRLVIKHAATPQEMAEDVRKLLAATSTRP